MLVRDTQARAGSQPNAPGEVEQLFVRYREDGDREALSRCLELVEPELQRVARYYAFGHEEALDFVQSTLVTALERADSFDATRRLTPWMVGILLRKMAMSRRKSWPGSSSYDNEVSHDPSPVHTAETEEFQELLEEALEHLPVKYRNVLRLHLRDGMGGLEIAKELHKPQGTIRAQIHRGLRLLRDSLPPSLALGTLWGLCIVRPGQALGRGVARVADGAWNALRRPLDIPFIGGSGGRISTPAYVPLSAAAVVALGAAGAWIFDERDGAPPAEVLASAAAESPESGRTFEEPRKQAPTSSATPTAIESSLASEPAALSVRTYDRVSGERLAGVRLTVFADLLDGQSREFVVESDADGLVDIALEPDELNRIEVRGNPEGYAPFSCFWTGAEIAFGAERELLFPLHASRPIGGRVFDPAGRPLANASVHLGTWELANGGIWRDSGRELVAHTDADGRWRHDEAPALSGRIHLRFCHQDYATGLVYESVGPGVAESLWSFEHERTLARSPRSLRVQIRDERGNPIAGANVSVGERRDPPQRLTTWKSDANGLALFPLAKDEPLLLRVEREPFAPFVAVLSAASQSAPVDVTLAPAVATKWTLVDHQGLPIRAARIRTMGDPWHASRWTDERGSFTLDLHPEVRTYVEIRRPQVLGSVTELCSVRRRNKTIHLAKPVRLSGVIRAPGSSDEQIRLQLSATDSPEVSGQRDKIGVLSVVAGQPFEALLATDRAAVQVEATTLGADPLRSGPLAIVGGEVVWTPELLPRTVLEGRIVGLDGNLIDFGEVAVAEASRGPLVSHGTLRVDPAGPRHVETAVRGDGRFSINRPQEPFALVVVSKQGFAFVPDSEIGEEAVLVVRPWGSVSGSAPPAADGSPARVTLRLDSDDAQRHGVRFGGNYTCRADDDGRFVIEGVPAGPVRVFVEGGEREAVRAVVIAGGTASVEL